MKNLSLFSFVFLVFFSINSYSQGVSDALRVGLPGIGSNARALGMGDAYYGLSDDASAGFYNPAGLGLVRKMEVAGGIEYTNFSNDVTFMNSLTNSSNSTGKLNKLSFALPFPTVRGSLVFAAGYNTMKDFSSTNKFDGFNNGNTSWINYNTNLNPTITYDLFLSDKGSDGNYTTVINGRLNQSGTITTKGSLNSWFVTGAMEVDRNLFVGLNINFLNGDYTSTNEYYEDDTQNLYQGLTSPTEPTTEDFRTFYLKKSLNWDITGWDAKIGVLYQIPKIARIGLGVQFPRTYYIKEDFSVDASSEFARVTYSIDPESYKDHVEYQITTPMELNGGFSVNFAGLIFSASASYVDYTQLEFSQPDGLSQSILDDANTNIKDLLRSVVNYNVGLEYTVPKVGLRLRGGFFKQPSAYKNDPSQFDKNFVTAGIGFLTENSIGIDLAYVHGWWQDYGDNYGVNLSRTAQDITYNKFVLTGTFRF